MSDTKVIAAAEGAVGTITLNHPKANSYDIHFMQDLDAAIESHLANDAVKVVVMKSDLEKFFSAGADIKAFQANSTAANMKMIRFAHTALRKMGTSQKVFIAAINGFALGGGLEMALACDLRFAAEGEYRMGLPEVTLGLLPGNGGTQRLPRLVGRTKALDLMITGRTVQPAEALELGIVDRLYPAAELHGATMKYATRLAAGATLAVGRIKQALMEGMDLPLDEALALERDLMEPLFDTADATEGIAAFAEKRQPTYTGR
ncbi:enoyl-CoA hydratase/isomerase family protein [bacterium]|nr:enoyl-CoA hydratase/isomerase family protein [bacterium]